MRKLVLGILATALCSGIYAQSFTTVGAVMPDYTFGEVTNYEKKTASIQDFRGKWLVLDYWSIGCGGCIASMPRMSGLQTKFAKDVQIMMVGYKGEYSKKYINVMFDKMQQKHNLQIPCAYDTALYDKFGEVGVEGVPLILVIDPEGKLRTVLRHIDEEEIRKMISSGEVPPSTLINEAKMRSYDSRKTFVEHLSQDGKYKFLYSSGITEWDFTGCYNELISKDRFEVWAMPLENLYKIAYFGRAHWPIWEAYAFNEHDRVDATHYGKIYSKVILELKDTSAFVPDEKSGKNKYCYYVQLSHQEGESDSDFKKRRLDIMKKDLESAFGYKVAIETRHVPYLRLVATKDAYKKLKSKGGKPWLEPKMPGKLALGFTLTNKPISTLLQITPYHGDLAILDETGITGNIDLDIDLVGEDLEGYTKELRKNGLDIVQAEKEMQVLVIRDK